MFMYLFTNTPLKFFVQSFWRDEAFSYIMAKHNVFQIIVLTAKDFSPPLYYLVLKLWMLPFGTSEIALRSLSLIFFFATLYVVHLFLEEVMHFEQKKVFFYLALFVFNPLLLYYAFEARMYTMFAFFATLSFYAYYQRKMTLYKIATVLGLFTHYFMILVVFTQIILALRLERGKKHFTYLLKQIAIPIIVFLPWVYFLFTQKASFSESFWIAKPSFQDILLLPGILYAGSEKEFNIGSIIFPVVFALLLLGTIWVGLRTMKKHDYHAQRHLFICYVYWSFFPVALVFLISLLYEPLFISRYLIFATVGFLLLIVFILDHLPKKIRMVALILIALTTYSYHTYQLKYRVKANYAKTIKEIKKLAKANDYIYVTNELDFFTAQYYFDKDRVFIFGKTYEELPNYVGKSLILKEKVVNKLPLFPQKAFILKNERDYDIQSTY